MKKNTAVEITAVFFINELLDYFLTFLTPR